MKIGVGVRVWVGVGVGLADPPEAIAWVGVGIAPMVIVEPKRLLVMFAPMKLAAVVRGDWRDKLKLVVASVERDWKVTVPRLKLVVGPEPRVPLARSKVPEVLL